MYFNRKVNLQFTFLQNAMRGKNKMELRCECSKRFLTDEGINSEEWMQIEQVKELTLEMRRGQGKLSMPAGRTGNNGRSFHLKTSPKLKNKFLAKSHNIIFWQRGRWDREAAFYCTCRAENIGQFIYNIEGSVWTVLCAERTRGCSWARCVRSQACSPSRCRCPSSWATSPCSTRTHRPDRSCPNGGGASCPSRPYDRRASTTPFHSLHHFLFAPRTFSISFPNMKIIRVRPKISTPQKRLGPGMEARRPFLNKHLMHQSNSNLVANSQSRSLFNSLYNRLLENHINFCFQTSICNIY